MVGFDAPAAPEAPRARGCLIDFIRKGVAACGAAVVLTMHVTTPQPNCSIGPGIGGRTFFSFKIAVSAAQAQETTVNAGDVSAGESGDANCDGRISAADLPATVRALGGNARCPSAAGVAVTIEKLFDPVEQSLRALAAGDLRTANELSCTTAAAPGPRNDRALLACGLTRLAVRVLDEPRLRSLLQRSGVVLTGDSRDVCGLDGRIPRKLPPGAPRSGEIVDTLHSVLAPEIDATLRDLKRLPDSVLIDFDARFFPACGGPGFHRGAVEVDHSDVLALSGVLQTTRAVLEILVGYNLDVDLATLTQGSAETVLMQAPQLLTRRSAANLSTAGTFVDQALQSFSMTVSSVLGETDDQSNDLLVIEARDVENARRIARGLDQVRAALGGEVVVMPDLLPDQLMPPQRLNLNPFFSGQFDTLRRFLPAFDDSGGFDFARFPDSTFGGTVPDLQQSDLCILRFNGRPLCP